MDLITCYGSPLPKVVSVFAGAYAVYVLIGFWKHAFDAKMGSVGLTTEGKLHVLLWTLAPPAWFFVEYWVASTFACPTDKEALAQIKLWQDAAKTFWAGVLAAILFLKGK